MEVHGCVADIVGGAAMVVNDRNAVHGFQQLPALHLIRAIRIHHDQQTLGIRQNQRVLAGQKDVLISGILPKQLQQLRRGAGCLIDHDVRLLAQAAAEGRHAAGRADGIRIGIAVAHQEDATRLLDQRGQGGGHHAGLDLAAPLGLHRPTAVEGEVILILDDRLIAAARERHFQRKGCVIVVFLKALAVLAHAEGEGGGDAAGIGNLAGTLKQGEFALRDPVKLLALKDEQEAVALQLPQKAADLPGPCADALIQGRVEIGDFGVRQVVGQLVEIVDQNDGNDRAGADVFIPRLQKLRTVHPDQLGRRGFSCLRLRGEAQTAEAPISNLHIVRGLLLAGFDPIQPKLRDHGSNALPDSRFHGAQHSLKLAVMPENLSVLQTDQGRRPRGCRGRGADQVIHRRLNRGCNALDALARDRQHENQHSGSGSDKGASHPVIELCRLRHAENQEDGKEYVALIPQQAF